MNQILERRLQRFENLNLNNYFGIIDTLQRPVKFHTTNNNEGLIFTACFKEVNNVINIKCLPMDIIHKISSYLNCYLKIKTKIVYPQDYPFQPPQWTLVCVKHNIETKINLKDYYEYLVETHNNSYLVDWSPAIHINIDILEFIRRINHFDYLLECR